MRHRERRMCKKMGKWGKCFVIVLAFSLICQNFSVFGGMETVQAAGRKLELSAENLKAKHASGHGAELAIDGSRDTFWQSIPSGGEGSGYKYNRMYDHNRYIDIALQELTHLSEIRIFNKTDGSYNNYYIYASSDGVNYQKIVSKTSNDVATEEGDSYTVDVDAAFLRLNMAYNSGSFATNLSEIELYGEPTDTAVAAPAEIKTENWEGSAWQEEWDKFETDASYASQKVIAEMSNLVGRVLGNQWKESFRFAFRTGLAEGKDIFEIKDGADGTIVIRGNSGLAMASGFNYYLKNYAGVDYNPMWGSHTALSEIVPVGERIVREAQFDIRYALNFCTFSYTMAFWNWDEYEEFLDWAAMNGINLILDIVGQEEVLRQTLLEFNYTDDEIKDYICGPAYFAWFYMQNLYSIGGPLPNAWFEQRTELGRKIHDRMQTYGIDPVIQAFAGQVPETFAEKNPGAVLTPVDEWPSFTRPSIIKTYLTDAEVAAGKVNYFSDAAEVFYEKQKNVFGDVSHFYAADPFHEGGNVGTLDVGTIYGEVQKEMLRSDPDAVWVMQQWQGNLNATKMSQLDKAKTLPLDLQADMNPQHGLFENNGAPWIYCMLHNFGGRMGLDGEVPVIAVDPIQTYNNTKNMKGIGMTPEAMENSPVVYELLFDTTWSKDPIDYRAWLKKYAKRRAGGESEGLNKAWKILLDTAYADKGITYQGAAETVINARPADNFGSASTWGHSRILYDKTKLDQALLLLIENYDAFAQSEAYKYDLADVAEQTLCNAAVEYHRLMVQAKNERDLEKFQKLSSSFLELIDLSDQILSTTDEFMLGTWIEAARKMIVGADDWTKDLFEFNARSLVTTWGGERSGSLKDYSNRKWAGLTKSFYKERWSIWIRNRIAELKGESKDPADEKAERNWFMWEYQWVQRKSDDENGRYAFDTTPSDANLAELAQLAFDKFSCTNLEKNTGGAAEEAENVANGKTATLTSGTTASGSLSCITDGDTAGEWQGTGTEPHSIEIDLEGTYDVSGILISVPQLAKDFPYTYKVEYQNPKTSAWSVLKEDANGPMGSNTEITKACTTNKIRVTMATADAMDSPLTITEIAVYGTEAEGEALANLARGILPTAIDRDGNTLNGASDGPLSNLTDGNTGSLGKPEWYQDKEYPVDFEIDLQQERYVEYTDVYFEKVGLPFEFSVFVTDADGKETIVSDAYSSHDNVLEARNYKIEIGQEVQKVTVRLLRQTGKGSASLAWPALAEVMIMGTAQKEDEAVDLSEFPVSGITASGGNVTNNVLDGNRDNTFDRVNTNTPIVFDLGGTYYLSHVNFVFEKAGLGIRYQVQAEGEDGERTMLSDQSASTAVLADKTVRVPVNGYATKLILTHMGNNGAGSAPQAETRLYEFEAFGVAKSNLGITASPKKAEGLLDGSAEYTASADTPIELTLEKMTDVNMVSVQAAPGETKALKYKVEYYDAQDEAWKMFADHLDYAGSASVSLAVPEEAAFTKQLRITFTESIRLCGLNVFHTDYAGLLKDRISQIEAALESFTYGDTYGMYKIAAKEKAQAVLEEAKALADVDSITAAEWMEKVDAAFEEFQETGAVYIDRSGILLVMSEVAGLLEKYPDCDEKETLEAMYQQARTLYDTYQTTQTALDEAKEEIGGQALAMGIAMEEKYAPELSAAKKENKEFLESLEERNEEDYPEEKWEEYTASVSALRSLLEDLDATPEGIALARQRLEKAILDLTKKEEEPPQTFPDPKPETPNPPAGTDGGASGNPNPPAELPSPGYEHKEGDLTYKVTASSGTQKTVMVLKPAKADQKKLTIPPAVQINGVEYKVTEIAAKAFYKNGKLTQASIGANVQKIGKQAFMGCKKLKKITIVSQNVKSVGKKAFAGIHKQAKVSVPKNKYKAYKKLFSKAKTAKSVKFLKKK